MKTKVPRVSRYSCAGVQGREVLPMNKMEIHIKPNLVTLSNPIIPLIYCAIAGDRMATRFRELNNGNGNDYATKCMFP